MKKGIDFFGSKDIECLNCGTHIDLEDDSTYIKVMAGLLPTFFCKKSCADEYYSQDKIGEWS